MASSSTPLVTTQQPESESYSETATSSGSDGKPGISWPLERPIHSGVFTQRIEEEVRKKSDIAAAAIQGNPSSKSIIAYEDLLPGQKRSQSGIAIRSFALGLTFGTSVLLYIFVAVEKQGRLWRPWFFLAALSLSLLGVLDTRTLQLAKCNYINFLIVHKRHGLQLGSHYRYDRNNLDINHLYELAISLRISMGAASWLWLGHNWSDCSNNSHGHCNHKLPSLCPEKTTSRTPAS